MPDPSTHFSVSPPTVFEKSSIENITKQPFLDNNHVQLLESGKQTFQKIFDAISSARHIICIEIYIFKDDEIGRKLAQLLQKKAGEGIRVYVIYDHFGSFMTSRRFWSELKKSGVKVKVSHPFRWTAPKGYKFRNHKKLIIIDGTVAITGGFNIANEYHGFLKKHKNVWRDMGIYLKGPIVVTLLDMFRKSWITWRGEGINYEPPHTSSANGVSVIPLFASSGRARRKLRRLIVYSIKNSKESIYLTTAYFIPGRRIVRAMKSASRRGIDVRLLLPGKTDVLSVFYAGRRYFTPLLKAGVKIYTYQESVLHSKTFLFDSNWCIIGSANLDFQSLRRNEESNVGILDRQFGKKMAEVFYDDLRKSRSIDINTWDKRPFHQKLLEQFFYFIMRKL